MKLFMVHVGYYDKSIGEGLYETHLNYFVAAEDAKGAKKKAQQLSEFQERSSLTKIQTFLLLLMIWPMEIKKPPQGQKL